MSPPHFDSTSVPRANALAGATLVITRPAGTSAAFAARARALGGDTLAVPGLSLREAADAPTARAALQAARGAHTWIFTSPAAVRFAFRLVPDLAIAPPARALCVGSGTARALALRGIPAIAPRASSDSEGLLALPELADVRGRRIALVCAPGGRDAIAAELQRHGALVEAIHVYQRKPPRLTRHHFEALAHASDPLITLLSSGTALTNLVALLPAPLLTRLRHQTLVVSSARLAALARGHGFEDILEAASALPHDLLEAAGKALARHRL
jgi:uroporphyrinogen-III synthase